MNDLELLAEYTRNRSDEAFAAIVERYIRLVHSACWRQMGDAQLAEDATQMVFVLLSRKAASLRHAELAGWLLTTAHYTCANIKRAETRRTRRETMVAMNPTSPAAEPNNELLELLDQGLLRLPADDREALVARFLRDEPLREVGNALGLTEDAARKRVERGLDKLRRFFQDRGIATDSAALTVVLTDHSHIPPIGQNLRPRILHAAKIGPRVTSSGLRLKLALSLSVLIGRAGSRGANRYRASGQRTGERCPAAGSVDARQNAGFILPRHARRRSPRR
jgi:RNA polymerase sigma factor (sigma-70 family)